MGGVHAVAVAACVCQPPAMPRINDPELAKQIGARVRTLRVERGLSQEELAERSKLAGDTVSRVERGSLLPSVPTVRALATGLDVPLSQVVGDEEHRPGGLNLTAEEHELVVALRQLPDQSLGHLLRFVVALGKPLP